MQNQAHDLMSEQPRFATKLNPFFSSQKQYLSQMVGFINQTEAGMKVAWGGVGLHRQQSPRKGGRGYTVSPSGFQWHALGTPGQTSSHTIAVNKNEGNA